MLNVIDRPRRNKGAEARGRHGFLPDTELQTMTSQLGLVQPASLELPVGDQFAIIPASQTPRRNETVREMLRNIGARVSQVPDEGLLLAPGTIALVKADLVLVPPTDPLGDRGFRLQVGQRALASPKSSIGRIDLFCRVITDRDPRYDEIGPAEDCAREIWIEIAPLSFPVVISRGDKLTQLRIIEGSIAPKERKRCSLGLEPRTKGSPVGYRAKRCHDPIRLNAAPGSLDPASYFEAVHATNGRIIMHPGDFYILKSAESITVSENECAQMSATDETIINATVHKAGFADPGFGVGSICAIVLEVCVRDLPISAEHGMPIARLDFFPMASTPRSLYGSAIGSNYQGQDLRLSKYFRQDT